jgi:hypothetical protein
VIRVRLLAPALIALAGGRLSAQCLPLRLPIGASTRGVAMGDANTAGRDDDVIFYGPAQLAVARGTSASVERYSDRLVGGALSTVSRIASGGVGLGAQIVAGRNEPQCSLVSVGPTGTFVYSPAPRNVTRMLAVLGGAQTFKRFRFGAAAKYAAVQAGDERTDRVMFDAGVSRDLSVLGDFAPLTVALAVQNIGTSAVDTVQLNTPLRAALGLATGGLVGPLDLGLAAQLAVERNDTLNLFKHGRMLAGLGAELGYTWLDGYTVAVRFGERVPPTRTDIAHFTFGAGLTLDRVSIDYAGEGEVGSRIAHRIGVRLR